MANISIPTTMVDGNLATASDMNGNWNEIQTKYNTGAVQTDVAKTITVPHTFTVNQNMNGGITGNVTGNLTGNVTGNVSGNVTGNLTGNVTGNVSGSSGSCTGNAATATTAGTVTTAAQPAITSVGTLVSPHMTGAVVDSGGLTVTAGGAAITGNSTVTGNLNVTGVLSGGGGLNNYVRRTTDLTAITTGSDLGLSFAIGAAEEWEWEAIVEHVNASAATLQITISGPASATGFFGGTSTVNGAGSSVVGGTQVAYGNALTSLTMSATAGWTQIRGYIKGGGTAGNVTFNAAVSAGSGTVKAGSFVRYCKIA